MACVVPAGGIAARWKRGGRVDSHAGLLATSDPHGERTGAECLALGVSGRRRAVRRLGPGDVLGLGDAIAAAICSGYRSASLLWFGFVRKGCVCSIGATQNITLAVFRPDYVVPLSVVAFFVLPLLFTVFFGRTFCASVCPLGAVQELIAVRSLRVPRWLDHTLGVIPYVYLGAAVLFAATGTAFVICRYDPFVAFFRLGGNANIVIFGVCLLLIGVFVGRPYCRYLCPYGAMLAMLSKFALARANSSRGLYQLPAVRGRLPVRSD